MRKKWFRERFGKYSAEARKRRSAEEKTSELKTVWIHAVSVGEVIASVSLIKKIKELYPLTEIIVSTVTDTGQKIAGERLSELAKIIYMPFDLPFSIKNALRSVKPSVFIIMETELWPNAIRIMSESDVPVCLMNGRISDKSFGGYKKLRFFINDVLNKFSLLCVQNKEYADRLLVLGAAEDKIKVAGSFKFDTKPSEPVPEWANSLRLGQGITIIAGSTHRTEEDLIVDAYIALKSEFPQLNLIVAPRHPERFREVEGLLQRRELQYIKRSEITDTSALPHFRTSAPVVLLDVIGELASVYGACDIAIMGGTFIEHGGQNPLEPAYWEKAIICGPHMENFPFMDEFYKNGAAVSVTGDTLVQELKALIKSPQKTALIGESAKRLYDKNSGAIDRAMKEIERIMNFTAVQNNLY